MTSLFFTVAAPDFAQVTRNCRGRVLDLDSAEAAAEGCQVLERSCKIRCHLSAVAQNQILSKSFDIYTPIVVNECR